MKVDTALAFDMRAPDFGASPDALYAAALDMAEFADKLGMDRIFIAEHHGSEDGYCSSPFLLAAAIAARTTRIRITVMALILPLHDPLRVAEDIAVLDNISGGRLEVVFGAGYVPHEFERFGISLKERGRRMDAGIDLIIRALAGERSLDGREILVRPLPVQKPHPQFYVGGGAEASLQRALRFGLGLAPMKKSLFDRYDDECRALGRDPGKKLLMSSQLSVHVTNDPEEGWAQIAPHALHVAASYAQWERESVNSSSPFAGLDTAEKVRASGIFMAVTPEQCVALGEQMASEGRTLTMFPLLAGLDPALAWSSLKLFAEQVYPRLR